ncbi:MAG: YqaA family protein [Acidobacteriota bacterium]
MVLILASVEVGFWDQFKDWVGVAYQFILTFGGPGLFLLALADSSFLSIPEGNDILIVVLSIGQTWERMAYYVVMTTLGSIVGCSLLYSVGRRGGRLAQRLLNPRRRDKVARLYRRWGSLAIVVPSILPPPTPFKVFVLSAGLFGIPFLRFLALVLIGRSIRYFAWGILALLYGESAREFLEQNMRTAGVALLLTLTGGIGLYVLLRSRAGKSVEEEVT